MEIECTMEEGYALPAYATEWSSGMDLRMVAWRRVYEGTEVRRGDAMDVCPGERVVVHTGLRIAIPRGFEGLVRPRSGMTRDRGIVAMVGTIDSDYRGEVGVTLINLGDERCVIHVGDRIAQIVIAPVVRARLVPVSALDSTARGEGGYGSTGRA